MRSFRPWQRHFYCRSRFGQLRPNFKVVFLILVQSKLTRGAPVQDCAKNRSWWPYKVFSYTQELNADLVIAQDVNTWLPKWRYNAVFYRLAAPQCAFVQAAGWAKAMRYLLTGDSFDAQTALQLNLIREITTAAPLSRAIELAERIMQLPLAVQTCQLRQSHWTRCRGRLCPFTRSSGAVINHASIQEASWPCSKNAHRSLKVNDQAALPLKPIV